MVINIYYYLKENLYHSSNIIPKVKRINNVNIYYIKIVNKGKVIHFHHLSNISILIKFINTSTTLFKSSINFKKNFLKKNLLN